MGSTRSTFPPLIRRSHPGRPGSVSFRTHRSDRDVQGRDDAKGAEGDGRATIVMRTAVDTKPMTPEEAALQMELLGHDFSLFANAETARAAVSRRPHDGNLGLLAAAG